MKALKITQNAIRINIFAFPLRHEIFFHDILLQAMAEYYVPDEEKYDKTGNDRRCIQNSGNIHFYQAHELQIHLSQ